MLLIRQTVGVDAAHLSSDCAVGRTAGLYSIGLTGTIWDTRFLPRAPRNRSAWSLIGLVLRGSVWVGPSQVRLEPGSGMVLREHHVLPGGPSRVVLRSDGDGIQVVALRVLTSRLRAAAETPVLQQLGPRITAELVSFAEVVRSGRPVDDPEQRLAAAVAAAVRDKLLTTAAAADGAREAPRPDLVRAGATVFPLLAELSRNPMLVDLVERASVTPRQILRDILRMQSEYDFPDRGWRELLTRWRTITAVLLLSANDMTPARVASEVGYGSVTAMGRAFRRQGLPPPSEVRRRIRDESALPDGLRAPRCA